MGPCKVVQAVEKARNAAGGGFGLDLRRVLRDFVDGLEDASATWTNGLTADSGVPVAAVLNEKSVCDVDDGRKRRGNKLAYIFVVDNDSLAFLDVNTKGSLDPALPEYSVNPCKSDTWTLNLVHIDTNALCIS